MSLGDDFAFISVYDCVSRCVAHCRDPVPAVESSKLKNTSLCADAVLMKFARQTSRSSGPEKLTGEWNSYNNERSCGKVIYFSEHL